MDKINAVRTVDGRSAVFLRFGQAGYVVVAAVGGERTIEHSIWMELPLWIPTTPLDPTRAEFDRPTVVPR
jgi:hypothetical protein